MEDSILIPKDLNKDCFISESLNIKEEIKNFIECIENYRNPTTSDNIQIKIVKDISDLEL